MNVKVYYNNNWVDITNNILVGQITLADRCDEAFGVGNFTFESNNITDLIPAYSRLIIDDVYYLCSSEITQNLITKTYIHNVEVLDATALFSRYIVGSKNFSVTGTNKDDYQKVSILTQLMNKKYNINIINPVNLRVLNKQIEYTFGAGTTLYDALCEILKNYNMRVKVKSILDDGTINWELLNLASATAYTLNENNILNYTIRQNADDYCKRLEGEMNNVVDRTNLTTLKNFTCRIDDVKLDYDNCKLLLPTRIEKLDTFEVISDTGRMRYIAGIKGKYLRKYGTLNNGAWSYNMPTESRYLDFWNTDIAESYFNDGYRWQETPLYKLLLQVANEFNVDIKEFYYTWKFKINSGASDIDENGNLAFLLPPINYIYFAQLPIQ